MRGSANIHHRPYFPLSFREARRKPYICRLAPFETGFEFEWLDPVGESTHTLCYGKRGEDSKTRIVVSDPIVRVEQLEPDCDYEFYLEAESGIRSNLRLVRTGSIPDGTTVINYLHPEDSQYDFSGKFLCSPSIVRTDSGRLIASMDVYGPKMAQNLTILFYSDDDGAHWRYLTDLFPFFWGSLFLHRGVLYMIGVTTEYGNLHLACSRDDGLTWSEPVTLFYGSNVLCRYGGMHRAPMHFTSYNGRLYTSCEYGCWSQKSHLPAALSIDENSDFMDPSSWVLSDFLYFEGDWKRDAETQSDTIEGNIVLAPDGHLYNYLRWRIGSLLKISIDEKDPEAPPEYVSLENAPVSNSMFRLFSHGDKYVLITNRKTEEAGKYKCWSYRNVLSIYESRDLVHFEPVKDIVNRETEDAMKIGFQYPAFFKNDDTLYLAIRSAFNNADSFHNSNYILFHKMTL